MSRREALNERTKRVRDEARNVGPPARDAERSTGNADASASGVEPWTHGSGAPARRSFELRNDAGMPIRGEALEPAGVARGSVVVCHGFKGFYRWGFFPYLVNELACAGLRVVVFNFSGSGVGDDRETFSEPDAFFANTLTRELDDLALVASEAAARGWIDARYGVFGHSRGGGIGIVHSADSPRVSALVTWAAVADTWRWTSEQALDWRSRGYTEIVNARTGQVLRLGTALLDEVEALRSSRLDVPAAAARVRAPWLIIHGAADETVPVVEAHSLDRARGRERSELLVIEGANHSFDIRHPMSAPSPALERATARTIKFFLTHSA